MIHDPVTLTVRRSDDEGKTWKLVEGVEDAIRLVAHPHNNNMAFIIGPDKKHWVTYNRGDSWQSFKTPVEASLIGEVLAFHAEQEGWILFQGVKCEKANGGWWESGRTCRDETYYTTDAFRSEPELLLSQTSQCLFARSDKALVDAPEKMVLCVAFDPKSKPEEGGWHSYKDSRLYASSDWFETSSYVDMGIGKRARGIVGLGVVSKFMVAALRGVQDGSRRAAGGDPMQLFVSTDGVNWRQTKFPHSAMPDLREK